MTQRTASARADRAALLGSGLALLGFILLPSFRAVVGLFTTLSEVAYPTPRTAAEEGLVGLAGGAILLLIGAGILLTAVARADLTTPGRRFGTALGVLGGAGYGLAGAGSRILYSWMAANLAETGAESGAQTAALWTLNLASGACLLFGILATCGWLIGGAGVSSPAPRIALIILGVMIAIGAFGPLLLFVQFLFVPAFAFLAVNSWRRLRTVGDTAADA